MYVRTVSFVATVLAHDVCMGIEYWYSLYSMYTQCIQYRYVVSDGVYYQCTCSVYECSMDSDFLPCVFECMDTHTHTFPVREAGNHTHTIPEGLNFRNTRFRTWWPLMPNMTTVLS